MSYENGNARDVGQTLGLASTPVVLAGLLLLFMTATSLADEAMIDQGKLVILPVAAALAAVLGRIWVSALPDGSFASRTPVVALLFAVVPIIVESLGFIDSIVATTFAFMAIATLFLVKSNRSEEATVLFSMVAGFHMAVAYAAAMPELVIAEGASLQSQLIDVQRAGLAANFFAFWAASMVLGTFLAIAFRGSLMTPGSGALFARLPSKIDVSEHRDLVVTGVVILLVNLIPLLWLAGISDAAIFESHLYLGSVWAMATSVVIMFVAFCRAERWHCLLYTSPSPRDRTRSRMPSSA